MHDVSDIQSKLWQAISLLESVIDGVEPIISDFQSIKSSDDQYECMDYGWASTADEDSRKIIELIHILINNLER